MFFAFYSRRLDATNSILFIWNSFRLTVFEEHIRFGNEI